jgi:hypothetical protein
VPGQKLDPAIKIYNKTGKHVFSVEPYISYFTQKGWYIYIIVQNNMKYQNTLDFMTEADAISALAKINEVKKIHMDNNKPQDYYSKDQIDQLFYTKIQVDQVLEQNKQESIDESVTASLSAVTILLDDYYTKTEIDIKLSGLSGDTKYIGDSIIDIGGINNGDYFSGTSMQDMWYTLLHPYQYPTISLSSNLPQTVMVGEYVNSNYTFTWSNTNENNINTGITLSGPQISLSNLPKSGSTTQSISLLQRTTQGSETWTINATNTKNGSLSDTVSVDWRYIRYWGTSLNSTLTDPTLLLNSEFSTSRIKSWVQDGNGEYIYYAFPVVFGDNDPNPPFLVGNLPNSDWTRTTYLVVYPTISINYYIYRTNYIQNGSGINISKL